MKKCILIVGLLVAAGCASKVARWENAGTLVSVRPAEGSTRASGRMGTALGEAELGRTRVETTEGVYNLMVEYRAGDMWAPRIDHIEALKLETEYFIDCVVNDKVPINDGRAGLRIVKMLEASDKSLKQSGKLIKIC